MIDNAEALSAFLPHLETAPWVALDTEADSLHAYPESLCLIQLSIPDLDALVDPLAGFSLDPLLEILRPRCLTMHGADYDLRLLYRTFGFSPARIFDTMWAARLVGHQEYSLRSLARHYLQVELEKGPQKANWALRPLTARMGDYARSDTRYLKPLADLLLARLKELERVGWHEEICDREIAEAKRVRSADPDSEWRLRGSDRLDRKGMAILRELWRWREAEARESKRPPFFVVSHDLLLDIARAVARGQGWECDLGRKIPSRRLCGLRAAVEQACASPASTWPDHARSDAKRLTQAQRERLARLTQLRDRLAEGLKLDPTLIASRAVLLSLAQDPGLKSNRLLRWQRELLASALD